MLSECFPRARLGSRLGCRLWGINTHTVFYAHTHTLFLFFQKGLFNKVFLPLPFKSTYLIILDVHFICLYFHNMQRSTEKNIHKTS